MRGSDLAGKNQLNTCIQALSDLRCPPDAGIFQDKYTALRLFRRDQAAGFQ